MNRHRLTLCFFVALAGCAAGSQQTPASPDTGLHGPVMAALSAAGAIPADARQALLVTEREPAPAAATAVAYEKRGAAWVPALPPIPAMLGRSGFAPPGEKREGDGRTPAGIFGLERAFGYGAEAPTRLRYHQSTADDLWVDDASAPDYNRWVRRGETDATSYEEMRRPDDLYKYGIVIEYNTDPVVPGHGSAIFFHVWGGEGRPTAGCVAMADDDVLRLLGWLDPAQQPVTIMGSEGALRDMTVDRGR